MTQVTKKTAPNRKPRLTWTTRNLKLLIVTVGFVGSICSIAALSDWRPKRSVKQIIQEAGGKELSPLKIPQTIHQRYQVWGDDKEIGRWTEDVNEYHPQNKGHSNELIGKLVVVSNEVTDKGISSIGTLQNLNCLSIESDKVTDDSLPTIALLPQLKVLMLRTPNITNSGMAILSKTQVHVVDLRRTAVNRDGIMQLADMPNLKTIYANVSEKDAEDFNESRVSRGLNKVTTVLLGGESVPTQM